MVSFPKLPTGVVTAPVRWAGCDANNVFHDENCKTALVSAGLLASLFLFNRYAAQRVGSAFNRPVQLLIAASTVTAVYLNRRSKLQTLATESAARTAFYEKTQNANEHQTIIIANKDGLLNVEALNQVKDLIDGQLKTIKSKTTEEKWCGFLRSKSYSVDPAGNNVGEPSQEGLTAAIKNQIIALEYCLGRSLDQSVKPGEVFTKGKIKALAAAQIAHSLSATARLLISLKNLPTQAKTEIEEDKKAPEIALRSEAEVRTYVQELKPEARKQLIKALNASWTLLSWFAEGASQKPDLVMENAGYGQDPQKTKELREKLLNAEEGSWQHTLLTTCNEDIKASAMLSWFAQAPQDDRQMPTTLTAEGTWVAAPYPTYVTRPGGDSTVHSEKNEQAASLLKAQKRVAEVEDSE